MTLNFENKAVEGLLLLRFQFDEPKGKTGMFLVTAARNTHDLSLFQRYDAAFPRKDGLEFYIVDLAIGRQLRRKFV